MQREDDDEADVVKAEADLPAQTSRISASVSEIAVQADESSSMGAHHERGRGGDRRRRRLRPASLEAAVDPFERPDQEQGAR